MSSSLKQSKHTVTQSYWFSITFKVISSTIEIPENPNLGFVWILLIWPISFAKAPQYQLRVRIAMVGRLGCVHHRIGRHVKVLSFAGFFAPKDQQFHGTLSTNLIPEVLGEKKHQYTEENIKRGEEGRSWTGHFRENAVMIFPICVFESSFGAKGAFFQWNSDCFSLKMHRSFQCPDCTCATSRFAVWTLRSFQIKPSRIL